MPIFQDLEIELRLDTLSVQVHSDRFGTGAEPYIVPVFFKIDGDAYSAILRIFNTQPPREGSTQVVETTPVQFVLESDPFHEPTTFFPPGPILFNQTLVAGDSMDLSNIAFRTTLRPIPLVIDVLGLFDLREIMEALLLPVLQETVDGQPVDLLNLTLEGISELLGAALGLDETLEACPLLDVDTEEFLNAIEAEMRSLIPGTVGGAFVAMENDDWDEDDVQTMQRSIREEIVKVLNDTTDSVTRVNPIPDTSEDDVDQDALVLNIILDLFLRFDPLFWFIATGGFFSSLLLLASNDEFVDFAYVDFDHTRIDGDRGFASELEGARISGALKEGCCSSNRRRSVPAVREPLDGRLMCPPPGRHGAGKPDGRTGRREGGDGGDQRLELGAPGHAQPVRLRGRLQNLGEGQRCRCKNFEFNAGRRGDITSEIRPDTIHQQRPTLARIRRCLLRRGLSATFVGSSPGDDQAGPATAAACA